MRYRIGLGYDIHQLGPERKLILGGVEIPYPTGLVGHSDADVLIHAIMDSILGALGEPGIGVHFPNTDKQYENISSMVLLEKIACILPRKDTKICNIDAVVIAENPKLNSYISLMCENISQALQIKKTQVNIKATTHEKLGPIGKGKGIAAQAVSLIYSLGEE